jgi:glycerol-3-phosphate acyltransferase PlsX
MKVAVDAMGGDHAPDAVVQGALQAVVESGVDVTLVGEREALAEPLGGNIHRAHVDLHYCEDMVHMDEPLQAVRRKKDASIRVAFDLVKRGQADAVVSAGNSGAMLAAAVLTLGRVEGIERPAFASILPVNKGRVVLIDVGANVDCRPLHLFQFGLMAQVFARYCLDMEEPRIGLLSIGEEGSKGNEQVRQAYDLFRASDLNFMGNVEGRDILSGEVQVIVCDGFVGNVALKLMEGMAENIAGLLQKEMIHSMADEAGMLFGREVFQRLKDRLDYAEYGGALILGIKGIGIVCHGGSSAKAIKNAVKMGDRYAREGIHTRLARDMARFRTKAIQGGDPVGPPK